MEKTRQIKIISLCALLVAVLGLTVAFASLSQTLTINGSAAVMRHLGIFTLKRQVAKKRK